MSNALAIAATTATLRNLLQAQIPLLDADLSDLELTTQPLDLARKGVTKAQLNLFLYQTAINGAWLNQDMPRQVRPGETGVPPLALNLHYLITAYGRGESDNDALSHRVLGGAMSVLHDHPVLGRGEISVALPNNDLGEQFERLKITMLPMALEEMSKLWMVFQTQYRISAAYEVTVLLIDSRAPVRAPLPVLKRGEGDRGVTTVAGLLPSPREIQPPNSQPAARLGEDIAIIGEQLTTADTTVRFTSSRLTQPIQLKPTNGTKPGELLVHLPSKTEDTSALSRWAPGFYNVALVVKKTSVPAMASNEVAFTLAPQTSVTPRNAAAGTINLTLTCEPRIITGQRIVLIFGDRQVEPGSVTSPIDTTQPTTLTFIIPSVGTGSYVVRLRVDGVDSIPVIYSGTPPLPEFDPLQKVTVA
jgi:Pvc16 N-terminal domain